MSALEDMQSRYREAHGRLWGGDEPPANSNRRMVPVKQVWPPRKLPMVRVPPVRDWLYINPAPLIGWHDIVEDVARRHGVSFNEILSKRRNKKAVLARHEACFLLREKTTLSFPQIGRRLGGRDHTTVLYAVRKHQARLDENAAHNSVSNSTQNYTKRPEMLGYPLSSEAVDK